MIHNDEPCNMKWQSLLKTFHAIDPNSKDAKEQWEKLKETAKNDAVMTPRQKEGIADRCQNAINGEYGKTKTADNYGHGKVIPATNGQAKH